MAKRWSAKEGRLHRKRLKQRIAEQEEATRKWEQMQEAKVWFLLSRLNSTCLGYTGVPL